MSGEHENDGRGGVLLLDERNVCDVRGKETPILGAGDEKQKRNNHVRGVFRTPVQLLRSALVHNGYVMVTPNAGANLNEMHSKP